MFTRIEDFAAEWEQEAALTARALDALTDESLAQPVVPGRRTLGQIAWHLVESPHYMSNIGLSFDGPSTEGGAPQSAAAVAGQYRRLSGALLHAVRTQWNDGDLAAAVELAGGQWSKGAALRFTLLHQAHHRGQMTVLMRQAGLRPPEIYGQTYDSWIDQGVAPLD